MAPRRELSGEPPVDADDGAVERLTPEIKAKLLTGASYYGPAAAERAAAPPPPPPPAPAPQPPQRETVERQNFSMPRSDYELFEQIRERALDHRLTPNMSEILRAAIRHFAALPDDEVIAALRAVDPIKPGRKKSI